jgi:hypothetical protein
MVWSSAVLAAIPLFLTIASGQANAQGVGFTPGISTIPDGVSLNVTPVVSADRRYVRLSLAPQFQTVNGFSNFPIPAAIAGGGNGGGGLGGLGGLGGGIRSVGLGAADFAYWYPGLGVPRASTALPPKPLKATTARSKKPMADPEIVPIRKMK